MTALAVVSPNAAGSEPPSSAARDELRRAIAQLAEAVRAQAAAQEPVDRLNAIIAAVAEAEARVTECRKNDAAKLDRWLDEDAAAGRPRPMVSPATIAAETNLAQLRAEGNTAQAALPGRAQAFAAAGAVVRAVTAMRNSAVTRVAAEAAIHYAATVLRERAAAAVAAESVVEGVIHELRQRGIVTGDIEALAAREQVIAARAEVRAEITGWGDVDRARRLLDRLTSDASAEL